MPMICHMQSTETFIFFFPHICNIGYFREIVTIWWLLCLCIYTHIINSMAASEYQQEQHERKISHCASSGEKDKINMPITVRRLFIHFYLTLSPTLTHYISHPLTHSIPCKQMHWNFHSQMWYDWGFFCFFFCCCCCCCSFFFGK